MQVAFKTAHQGARKIKAQPGRLGVLLKRMEEPLRVCNPPAGIAEANRDSQVLAPGTHGQFLPLSFLHGALAVLCQVEEDLHQALTVSPHRRQILLYLPAGGYSTFTQRRLDDDAQLV